MKDERSIIFLELLIINVDWIKKIMYLGYSFCKEKISRGFDYLINKKDWISMEEGVFICYMVLMVWVVSSWKKLVFFFGFIIFLYIFVM